MQDKEFDELFRSKLADFEVQPSKRVWDNVAAEVIIERPNRSAWPYISVAASILVLVTAGLFFIPQQKDGGKKEDQITKAENNKPAKEIIAAVKITKLPEPVKLPVQIAIVKTPKLQNVKAVAAGEVNADKSGLDSLKNNDVAGGQMIATAERPATSLKAVVPNVDTQLDLDPAMNNVQVVNKPLALTAQLPTAKTIAVAPVKKKRGIRSLGDLINVVVSTVDKRKDKIVEFSNTEDDESIISGINLGIIRVKREDAIAKNK